jgi:hypothetical protein
VLTIHAMICAFLRVGSLLGFPAPDDLVPSTSSLASMNSASSSALLTVSRSSFPRTSLATRKWGRSVCSSPRWLGGNKIKNKIRKVGVFSWPSRVTGLRLPDERWSPLSPFRRPFPPLWRPKSAFRPFFIAAADGRLAPPFPDAFPASISASKSLYLLWFNSDSTSLVMSCGPGIN